MIECIKSIICKENVDGKECYKVTDIFDKDLTITYDKQIGLPSKIEHNGSVTTIQYDFDNVEDSIFIEPDASEYGVNN